MSSGCSVLSLISSMAFSMLVSVGELNRFGVKGWFCCVSVVVVLVVAILVKVVLVEE